MTLIEAIHKALDEAENKLTKMVVWKEEKDLTFSVSPEAPPGAKLFGEAMPTGVFYTPTKRAVEEQNGSTGSDEPTTKRTVCKSER